MNIVVIVYRGDVAHEAFRVDEQVPCIGDAIRVPGVPDAARVTDVIWDYQNEEDEETTVRVMAR